MQNTMPYFNEDDWRNLVVVIEQTIRSVEAMNEILERSQRFADEHEPANSVPAIDVNSYETFVNSWRDRQENLWKTNWYCRTRKRYADLLAAKRSQHGDLLRQLAILIPEGLTLTYRGWKFQRSNHTLESGQFTVYIIPPKDVSNKSV